MRFRKLHSTWLEAVAYEPLTQILTVRYQNGKEYRYFDVPRRVYDGLIIAESPGAFFNEWVRDRGYRSVTAHAPQREAPR